MQATAVKETDVSTPTPQAPPRRAALAAATLAAASGLFILSGVLKHSGAGFDFTDESLYILWIQNPAAYPVSITQFGFIYHPLFRALGGDLALLRAANVVITAMLAWGLSWLVLRRFWPDVPGPAAAGFAIGLSALAMTPMRVWLPTPNYNWLTLQALTISAAGFLLTMGPRATAGAVLLGLGGWLTLMAKPTSAGVLALLALAGVVCAGRERARTVAIAALTSVVLLVATAFVIDGSLAAFWSRHALGLEDARALSESYELASVLRFEWIELTPVERRVYWSLFLWSVALVSVALRGLTVATLVATAATAAAVFGIGLEHFVWPWKGTMYIPVWIGAPALGAAAAAVVMGRPRQLSKSSLAAIALLGLLPMAFALGTGSNYVRAAAQAGIFWVLAAVALTGTLRRQPRWQPLAPLIVGAQLVTAIVVHFGAAEPYRQEVPLAMMRAPVTVGAGSRPIRVEQERADYIDALRAGAMEAGFMPGTPLIDLTGHYPGAAVVLGGTAPGAAWLSGGYPGSLTFASTALGRVPCEELARAWVLVEPKRRGRPLRRSLPPEALASAGFDLERDYVQVVSVMAPRGDYNAPVPQQLFKPTGSGVGLGACAGARAARR